MYFLIYNCFAFCGGFYLILSRYLSMRHDNWCRKVTNYYEARQALFSSVAIRCLTVKKY